MRMSGRPILIFDSPNIPETVKYNMELVQVGEYSPGRLVGFNFNSLPERRFIDSPTLYTAKPNLVFRLAV